MTSLYDRLLEEGDSSPDERHYDKHGNALVRMRQDDTARPSDPALEALDRDDLVQARRDDPLIDALASAVLEDEPVDRGIFSVVTGEPVEPDHPDSPLRRAGLI